MKKQIITIHGGDTFKTYEDYIQDLKDFEINFDDLRNKKWRNNLTERLGEEYEVLSLQMPNKFNAKYIEWKIWFDKYVPFFDKDIILIGHSLGGIFLAKYLAENEINKNIVATLLVAPPFDDKDSDYSLVDFILPADMCKLEKQGGKIIFYHSKDDPIVPFVDVEKYKKVVSGSEIRIFEDRGHFFQSEFPEIVEDIKTMFS